MFRHNPIYQFHVTGFTDYKLTEQNAFFEAGREIIKYDNFLTLLTELLHCVAAYVASATSHEY